MALGTITTKRDTNNLLHVYKCTILGDGAYPTGGTASFKTTISNKLGKSVKIIDAKGVASGYIATYDYSNDKLKVYTDALVEASNAADLSAVLFDVTVWYE